MKNVLNIDTPFFRAMGKIGDIFLLNFIFVITSIPLITIGASITALMTIAIKMTTNKEGYIVSGYLKAFRSNFKQATVIHILSAILGGILFFDLHFWVSLQNKNAGFMIIISVIPIMVYCMVLLYVYVQQAIFENRITATIRNALLMAVKNLPGTLLLGVVVIAIICVMYFFESVRIFMVLYGFGLSGYGMAVVYRYIYREYLDEPEEENTELPDESVNEDIEKLGIEWKRE
ncbi:MAG: DUF624 domain-containing protein [Lachnospiraceae bacterium]|nr:DUF624 domain-containing protein [Lachnospiraceae bacterium]